MKTEITAEETRKIQIASVMDDSGSNEICTVEMTETQEKQYNDGMARLAEYWG